MNPMEPSSIQQSSTRSRKKLWIILGGIAGLFVIAGIVIFVLLNRPATQNNTTNEQQVKPASESFDLSSTNSPVIYAGSAVYDACNFISYNTLKKTIPNFTKLLDTVGTKDRASQPVMIQHDYIDRNIASPLGKDASPREPGTVISQSGAPSIDAFISPADGNCTYGQTADQSFLRSSLIKNTFAQLYVTQKPTPLSSQFLNFIQGQKKFEDHDYKDLDIYAMPEKDSNGYFTSVFVKKDHSAAVIFKTGIEALLNAAGDDIAATLSKPAAGPLTITYPEAYKQLTSPCELLSADDFTRFTGKPTGALASEAAFLTEVGNNSIRRECERLEIDRDILKSNIVSSNVVLMQSRSTDDAKQFMTNEKENSVYEVTNLKAKIALGDQAFIKKKSAANKLENPYSLLIRKGASIVEVAVDLDSQDASADVFEARIIPVAQSVLQKLAANR